MPLLGSAALAMWWEIAPDMRREFQHWHSHEHFPERLAIPGFRRGSRWADVKGGEGFFVLYELADYQVLTSPTYVERLNDPTPWSSRMMPHHGNMVRSQCRVLESFGASMAGFMATLRLSPAEGKADALRSALRRSLEAIAARPGLCGGHLLRTDTPQAQQTREQKIRGGDAAADWIVLLPAYDLQELRATAAAEFAALRLVEAGAAAGSLLSLFRLSQVATPQDLS